jgi:hypothetical protein
VAEANAVDLTRKKAQKSGDVLAIVFPALVEHP